MAICEYCGKEMLTADGCDCAAVVINGKIYNRFRVGAPGSMDEYADDDPDFRCHDCGARTGEYHHPGCDMERCPACGEQMAFCGCVSGIVVPMGKEPRQEGAEE